MFLAAPGWLWLALLVPLVIIAHLVLRARRTVVVPSVLLWRETAGAGRPWRRLLGTILPLLIKAAVVLAAVLALAVPILRWTIESGRTILIDDGPAMAWQDRSGTSPWAAARAWLARESRPGDQVRLASALGAPVTMNDLPDRPGWMTPDLAAVAGGLIPAAGGSVVVLSGRVPPAGFVPAAALEWHSFAADGPSVGVEAVVPGREEVFITLRLSNGVRQTAAGTVFVDGAPSGTFTFETGAGLNEVAVAAPIADARSIEVVLTGGDAFAGDDYACLALPGPSAAWEITGDDPPAALYAYLDAAGIPHTRTRLASGRGPAVITGRIEGTLPAGACILFLPEGRISGLEFAMTGPGDEAMLSAAVSGTGLPVPPGTRITLAQSVTGTHTVLLEAGGRTAAGMAEAPGMRTGFFLFDPQQYPAVVDTPLFPILMDRLMRAVGAGRAAGLNLAVGGSAIVPPGTLALKRGMEGPQDDITTAGGVFQPREPGIHRHPDRTVLAVNPPVCLALSATAGARTYPSSGAGTRPGERDLVMLCAGLALALYALIVVVEP